LKQLECATASYQYGQIYAQLGDRDRAFAEPENAIRAKDSGLYFFKMDPFPDPIRADPRYGAARSNHVRTRARGQSRYSRAWA
jgi:hypothetical protein